MAAAKRRRGLSSRWSRDREIKFLEHLALSANVAASERVAKVTPGSAYRQRNRSVAFRRSWDLALRDGYAQLELAMLERALHGTPVVIIARDGTETRKTEYSDRTAMTLLAAHRAAVNAMRAADESEGAKERLDQALAEMSRKLGDEG